MKRVLIAVASALALAAFFLPAASSAQAGGTGVRYSEHPTCAEDAVACTELAQPVAGYTGHDEPSLLFYSNHGGSGNSDLSRMPLPTDPPTRPVQDGTGGTFNFQLHPAFWFGMAMCDDQSAPNPGGSTLAGANNPCTANSDSNIYTSTTVTDPNYIGKHPGVAFMEMQFYPPGWIKWPAGDSCDPTKWCAALNIDSLSQNSNSGASQNANCLSRAGGEPVNFASSTRSGVAQAAANEHEATLGCYTPMPSKDLMMHSGDQIVVEMHDTLGGFEVVINDGSSGQSGSMTASVANG